MKALFVCTGNSCRSVMAQFLFDHEATRLGLADARAASCGIASQPHFPIPAGVRKVLAKRGIPELRHVPRLVSRKAVEEAETVYAMARGHLEALQGLYPQHARKVRLFLEAAGLGERDVDDPIGRSDEVYEQCCALIERGVLRLLGAAKEGKP